MGFKATQFDCQTGNSDHMHEAPWVNEEKTLYRCIKAFYQFIFKSHELKA